VLGRKISYQPLTIPQYRERLEKAGLPEFMIQHFCAVALDWTPTQNAHDLSIVSVSRNSWQL
jgi:hypothetical protein